MKVLPVCPWCHAPHLQIDWSENGLIFCECAACHQRCFVERDGHARRFERRTDVQGNMMDAD
jgi:Zn ribbon nucleic-acid-binding protein